MTKRMLIDATHAEETRVVVLDGNRLEDFDVETSTKKQIKGNIYLAKVVRVEPSLQAAFVDYGGNRHGFLAFDEIHPDYYQIPVADRERLLQMQVEQARREQEEDDRAAEGAGDEVDARGFPDAQAASESDGIAEPASLTAPGRDHAGDDDRPENAESPVAAEQPPDWDATHADLVPDDGPIAPQAIGTDTDRVSAPSDPADIAPALPELVEEAVLPPELPVPVVAESVDESGATTELLVDGPAGSPVEEHREEHTEPGPEADAEPDEELGETDDHVADSRPPEIIGGEHDTVEDSRERRVPPRFLRNYKIQEVIRRRQILLVQVVKEERGTKGAALTTYISLAGRYGVLMPNSPRGGGISRKITAAADRARLKEVMAELDLPPGMGLIVRTAGANRPKAEIKRDCEYLLRLWDDIREHTMRSVAPALIYEEASLIKRAIRDVYSRDIDEINVDGEDGWRAARDFMRMLMPTHVKKVQLWRDSGPAAGQPLFARYQVDSQLDAILSPTVQLRSGGYLVINQAEALVAIDVNSGRSTRERGIEETALRTNLEAADEVARQLRLRDLAGLIVIDFIDMESRKHNGMVERRLKDALKADRARIQLGHISHFGLLEMSRQRLRPSLAETSFVLCPHCGGTGHVRSIESAAIHVLRGIEEEGAKRRAAEVVVHCAADIAMYILNHKRDRLSEIEARTGMHVMFAPDDTLVPPQFRIERLRAQVASEVPAAITAETGRGPLGAEAEPQDAASETDDDSDEFEDAEEQAEGPATGGSAEAGQAAENGDRRPRRRRRRRRGRRDDGAAVPGVVAGAAETGESHAGDRTELCETHVEGVPEHPEPALDASNRRPGRRSGRRRRRPDEDDLLPIAEPGADQPDLPPVYVGPTPADPFGGRAFDIFDVLEQAEERAVAPVAEMPVAHAEPEPALPDVVERWPVPEPVPDISSEAAALAPPEPHAAGEPVAEPPHAANDREPEPAIKPIVVGAEDAPPAERKRGWWRR